MLQYDLIRIQSYCYEKFTFSIQYTFGQTLKCKTSTDCKQSLKLPKHKMLTMKHKLTLIKKYNYNKLYCIVH